MTDPINPNASAAFGGNDHAPKFERDERFVTCLVDAKPDSWDFGPGDNYFFVLPSSSDYASLFPSRAGDYQVGKPYHRISVKVGGASRARNFRAPRENELSKAYWRLYESLGANKPLWKEITDGFSAGGDWRRCLNIVVMKPGPKMSTLKMFSSPDERASKKPGQKDALYVMIKNALLKAYGRVQAQNPGAYPFFPQTAVLLKLSISFRGTMPQYDMVDVYENNGQMLVQDLTSIIGDPANLDAAGKWCAEYDQLPGITEVASILKSPQACEILGLRAAQQPMGSAPTGFQTQPQTGFNPNPQQQFAAAPPAQPAFTPQTSAPTGFGTPAAAPAPAAAPFNPAAAPAPAAQAAPVNPAPNAAAASAMFSTQLAAEIEKRKAAGTPPAAGGPF